MSSTNPVSTSGEVPTPPPPEQPRDVPASTELTERVHEIATKLGIANPETITVMERKKGGSAASGSLKKGTGCVHLNLKDLEGLSKEAVNFVIGHELTHLKHDDHENSEKLKKGVKYVAILASIVALGIGLFAFSTMPLLALVAAVAIVGVGILIIKGYKDHIETRADRESLQQFDTPEEKERAMEEYFESLKSHNLQVLREGKAGWRGLFGVEKEWFFAKPGDNLLDWGHPLTSRRIDYLKSYIREAADARQQRLDERRSQPQPQPQPAT